MKRFVVVLLLSLSFLTQSAIVPEIAFAESQDDACSYQTTVEWAAARKKCVRESPARESHRWAAPQRPVIASERRPSRHLVVNYRSSPGGLGFNLLL